MGIKENRTRKNENGNFNTWSLCGSDSAFYLFFFFNLIPVYLSFTAFDFGFVFLLLLSL